MGLFYSRPPCPTDESAIIVSPSSPAPRPRCPSLDLPVDVYTCILEFLVDLQAHPNDNNENMDVSTMTCFRLVNKSTKLAFDKMQGWASLYTYYQRKVSLLDNKIIILQSAIADPPSLTCILKFDAYLTQCYTLKNALSRRRNLLREKVLGNVARLAGAIHKNDSNDTSLKLMLISEWEGDECILRFEPIGNEELHGFALPAIDQSELPFVVA